MWLFNQQYRLKCECAYLGINLHGDVALNKLEGKIKEFIGFPYPFPSSTIKKK